VAAAAARRTGDRGPPDRGLAPGWTGSQAANWTGSGTAGMSSTVGSESPSARQPCELRKREGVRRRMRGSNAFSPSYGHCLVASAVVDRSPNAWAAGPAQAQAQKNCGSGARGAVRAERCAWSVARKNHPRSTLKPSGLQTSPKHSEDKCQCTSSIR
jgi:hypothetical protein